MKRKTSICSSIDLQEHDYFFSSNQAKEMKNERQSLDPQVDDGLFLAVVAFFVVHGSFHMREQNDLPSSADLSKKKND